MDFYDIWLFFENLSRKLKVSLKSDKNNAYGVSYSTKSPASGRATVSEPTVASLVGKVREVVCAWISVYLRLELCSWRQFLRDRSCFLDTSVARKGVGWRQDTPVLSYSGQRVGRGGRSALIHAGCYHVTEFGVPNGLCDDWRSRLSFKFTWSLFNHLKYTLHEDQYT
jgi:hypothetical protein